MKLAFSTLGCPEWTLQEILKFAQREAYQGIEFRGLLDKVELTEIPEFLPARIAETRRKLADAGIGTACMSSSIQVVASSADEKSRQGMMKQTKQYLDLAAAMGAPVVRVFCGNIPEKMDRATAITKTGANLHTIGDIARDCGVVIVVETHDAFTSSAALMALINHADHPNIQALWDIHHPYRMGRESVNESMQNFQGHVYHTHIKDSVVNADGQGYTYSLLGQGDVPILEAIRALEAKKYDGYYTLEWEKRWIPSLAPPEIAFAQFAQKMREWMG